MLIVALLTFVSIVLCFPVVELSDMYLPEGVMSIWNYAFNKNQLTSVTIPQSVSVIGGLAF